MINMDVEEFKIDDSHKKKIELLNVSMSEGNTNFLPILA
jgi:hypothetical protein